MTVSCEALILRRTLKPLAPSSPSAPLVVLFSIPRSPSVFKRRFNTCPARPAWPTSSACLPHPTWPACLPHATRPCPTTSTYDSLSYPTSCLCHTQVHSLSSLAGRQRPPLHTATAYLASVMTNMATSSWEEGGHLQFPSAV